ncbi:MAG: MFS transporter, partial [Ktedonobacteraceae bacterium]|nr:MFS transporter [Ktedonobacteraceae bacterium]
AGAVSGVMWGRAIDRWPTGFTLALTLVLGALGALSVLTHHLLLEAIGAALFGLSVFLGPPLIVTFLLRQVIPAERYPSSYSLLNTLFGIGQVLGPLVGGFIVEQQGLVSGTAFTAAVLFGAALLALSYGMLQHYLVHKHNTTVYCDSSCQPLKNTDKNSHPSSGGRSEHSKKIANNDLNIEGEKKE